MGGSTGSPHLQNPLQSTTSQQNYDDDTSTTTNCQCQITPRFPRPTLPLSIQGTHTVSGPLPPCNMGRTNDQRRRQQEGERKERIKKKVIGEDKSKKTKPQNVLSFLPPPPHFFFNYFCHSRMMPAPISSGSNLNRDHMPHHLFSRPPRHIVVVSIECTHSTCNTLSTKDATNCLCSCDGLDG
jgi:hypothetical protein